MMSPRAEEIFPLHQFLGIDASGQETLVAVHAPWSPMELCNLIKKILKIKDPVKFQEELKTVMYCYNPTWADLNQLLKGVLPRKTLNLPLSGSPMADGGPRP